MITKAFEMSENFQGCSSSTTVFRQVKDKTIESKNIEPISPQRKLTLKPPGRSRVKNST